MGRAYKISRINPDRYYSVSETAENQCRHVRTVQSWLSQGLAVLDKKRRPYLILGADLIQFLRMKQHSRRVELKDDECYCVKCRAARKGIPETLELVVTGESLGPQAKQVILRGICEVCKTEIQRFTSDNKVQSYKGDNMKFKELLEGLERNDGCSLNSDKLKEELKWSM